MVMLPVQRWSDARPAGRCQIIQRRSTLPIWVYYLSMTSTVQSICISNFAQLMIIIWAVALEHSTDNFLYVIQFFPKLGTEKVYKKRIQ